MKTLIVYYSYSGNTKKVAEVLKDFLSQQGPVDIMRLEPKDESTSFFGQANRAFWGKRAVIKNTPFDVSGYDMICVGTPVWAFGPAPAMNTYLDGVKGLSGKRALSFVTYGSGAGMGRCLVSMKKIFEQKGAVRQYVLKVQQGRVDDIAYVRGAIAESIKADPCKK